MVPNVERRGSESTELPAVVTALGFAATPTPKGRGFMAATRTKRAGNVVERRARDRHLAVLERLPQHLDTAAGELRQLVEEQHAVVGEAGPPCRQGWGYLTLQAVRRTYLLSSKSK
jgi:hypothetical protein